MTNLMTGRVYKHIVVGILLLVPFFYLAYIWGSLPTQIPVHFNAQMQPDRFGDKSEMVVTLSVLSFVSLFVYVLLTNLSFVDPKYQKDQSPKPMEKLAFTLVMFMSAIGVVIVYSSYGHISGRIVFVLLGLLFSAIGYFIKDIKPNYYAGIRLPWTLESVENWNKTHQLTGKVWMWGGASFIIGSHLVSNAMLDKLFMVLVGVLVIVPTVYSFRLYTLEKKSQKGA